MDLVPVLLATIAVFAGLVNLFLTFLLYVIWGEIKSNQKKHDNDIDTVYEHMRADKEDIDLRINHIDNSLHSVKNKILMIAIKLGIDPSTEESKI